MKAKSKKSEVKMKQEQTLEISILINAIFYFIERVFIIKNPEREGCRLVVMQNRRVKVYEDYETVRGARIAFNRMFKRKAWKSGIKPDWSHFFDPDEQWLDEKLETRKLLNGNE